MATALITSSMLHCRHSLTCLTRKLPHSVFRTRTVRFSEARHSKLKKFNRKLEFEKDTGVKEDILLFSNYENEKINIFYSVGSVIIGLCCINSAHFIYTSMKNIKPPEMSKESQPWMHWWQTLYMKYDIIPRGMALIIFAAGIATMWMAHLNISHQVRSLTLLKGGDTIILEHYGFFGRIAERKLNLGDVSSVPTQAQYKDYIPIKVKHEIFNYYLELEGQFPDRKLFNNTVGMYRPYKKN